MAELIKNLSKLIDGDWQYANAAREACKNNTWTQFQLKQMPKPFILNCLAFFNYNECLSKSVEIFRGPFEEELKLIPVWKGENYDDTPSNNWKRAYVSSMDKDHLQFHNTTTSFLKKNELNFDSIITIKVRKWDVGIIVKTKYYSPSVPLVIRGIVYSLLAYEAVELMEIVQEEKFETIEKPTKKIQPFCCRVLPALKNIPDDILQMTRAFEIDPH